MSISSTAAVRKTYSQGMIALIAISIAILFPAVLFGIYAIRKKIKRAKRGGAHRDSHTTMSIFQTDIENKVNPKEEKLLLEVNDNLDKDALE